jgi:hypothetical protein
MYNFFKIMMDSFQEAQDMLLRNQLPATPKGKRPMPNYFDNNSAVPNIERTASKVFKNKFDNSC